MKYYNVKGIKNPVSAMGLGTLVFHPRSANRDTEVLNAFVEQGGTYVDTAELYGAEIEHGYSEIVIGEWLDANPGIRDKLVLCSKGLIPGTCEEFFPDGGAKITPECIHKSIDGSLKRLKTDYLDIWMFHRDDESHPVGPLVDALDEEIKAGRIKGYGGSNWSVPRIAAAIEYAQENGKFEMMSSSPNFSLARPNEPFWEDTTITSAEDEKWYKRHNFLVAAWSPIGRGFFDRPDRQDIKDGMPMDTALHQRVFHNPENLERKKRAWALGESKSMTAIEIALAYATNQDFPVIAINGAETVEQVASSAHATSLELTTAELNWLDLHTDEQPF